MARFASSQGSSRPQALKPQDSVTVQGASPKIIIGDAGEEDTMLVFDGNAQDFYVAIDDTTDDLTIGTGLVAGTAVKMVIENGGNVGIGDTVPGTLLQLKGADAYLTLQNSTAENTAGGAETKIIFEDHANASLAVIQASHDGTSDDTKGHLVLSTHNGSALTEAIRINSNQVVTFGEAIGSFVRLNRFLDPYPAADPHPTGQPAGSDYAVGQGNGDIVLFGSTTSMTAGTIYYLKSDFTWAQVDADAVATAGGCMLAVAMGAASNLNGMLVRGMVRLSHDPGDISDVLYVSTTAGQATGTAPSGTGDVVRVVGYNLHASNGLVYFDPDHTWVEVA